MTERAAVPAERDPSVSEYLIRSSQSFAQSAIAAYAAETWDVFHLNLATAVELLVKAALAHANPAFIADPTRDFDFLLHLCGMGHRARKREFAAAVRTVTASELRAATRGDLR